MNEAERHHSSFVLDVLNNGQPVQRVAKCRHKMLAQLDTSDEPHVVLTADNISYMVTESTFGIVGVKC